MFTVQDGEPFSIMTGTDNSLSGVGDDRANLVGNPSIARPSRNAMINEYFNTAAFVANPLGTFGNSGRNILEAPGSITLNVSLSKSFKVRERQSLQVRADSFNLPNIPNFSAPNGKLSATAFGRINSAGSGRVDQISMKYIF